MNFKDIERVMGFQDLADYSLPKCENLPTQLWKLITGNKHSTGADSFFISFFFFLNFPKVFLRTKDNLSGGCQKYLKHRFSEVKTCIMK